MESSAVFSLQLIKSQKIVPMGPMLMEESVISFAVVDANVEDFKSSFNEKHLLSYSN